MLKSPSFHDVVRNRRSIRSFLPKAVDADLLRAVADDARHAPSNANIQPWQVHIVSGETRNRLSQAMLEAEAKGRMTPDFPFSYGEFYGPYSERQKAQGAAYYQALGVAIEDFDERRSTMLKNLEFFGAPHVCLLFMPAFHSVRIAGDVGMYGQTFLLALEAHGLGGVPQTLLGFFADTAREVLDIDPAIKMLFGISFGYPDMTSAASQYRIEKAQIEETVIFHQ